MNEALTLLMQAIALNIVASTAVVIYPQSLFITVVFLVAQTSSSLGIACLARQCGVGDHGARRFDARNNDLSGLPQASAWLLNKRCAR